MQTEVNGTTILELLDLVMNNDLGYYDTLYALEVLIESEEVLTQAEYV